MNHTFTVEQLIDQNVIDQLADQRGDVDIVLADGHVTLPMRLALFNGMLWSIYVQFQRKYPELGITIDKSCVYFPDRAKDKVTGKVTYSFTSETVSRCVSTIYNELILRYKIPEYMEAVAAVWDVINRFAAFADKHTKPYQVSLDALSLSRICAQKPIADIINRQLDSKHGTKYAEKQMDRMTSDLMQALAQPGLVKNNVLIPFMRTKLLKRNQVPQMFGAFGPRSDITDEMKNHVVSAAAFSGLTGVEDFAIESLSAKKAEFFNNSVIRDAQYFARRVRLGASRMPKLYEGSCGSTTTIPFVIDPKFKKNFYGKWVLADENTKDLVARQKYHLYDDNSIELNAKNIDLFVGREIQMWSPFGCRYQDGFCEHCAGYMHQRLAAYIPEGMHVGVFFGSKTVSAITQKILSSKHLIKTSSKEFNLPQSSAKFFQIVGSAIFWSSELARPLRKLYLRLETNNLLGPLNDLTRKFVPPGVSFSKIKNVGLVDEKGQVKQFLPVSDGSTTPYFSQYAMHYLSENFSRMKVDAEYIDVPLDKFEFDKPILSYTASNDDMVSFVDRADRFMMSTVRDYTNIRAALQDLAALIYDKADVSIFAIEVLLRCYLISGGEDPNIPVITDPNAPVEFAGLGQVISTAALSTKFAYEGVGAFLCSPRPALKSIGAGRGMYDMLYNFGTVR